MRGEAKNILGVAGVISIVLGIIGAVPSFLREMDLMAIGLLYWWLLV